MDLAALGPNPEDFGRTVGFVQAYTRGEPGAQAALLEAAQADPDTMTMSLVALGAVLLDIAAEAFHLTPFEMLDKVAAQVADVVENDRS